MRATGAKFDVERGKSSICEYIPNRHSMNVAGHVEFGIASDR